MGVDIFRFLGRATARGPVPKKHLVQDFDGDGEFDNYFHLKALTINGVFDGNPTSFVTLNGSSNWSGYAAVSDENFGILVRRSPTLKYQQFIDFWYENFPKSAPLRAGIDLRRSTATRTSTWTDLGRHPGGVRRVDDDGIALWGFGDRAIDVLFDGRRVWSFWLERDTADDRARGPVDRVAARRCASSSTAAPG